MPRTWFHITWNTYGTWLPGDPRGFRSHNHRIHSSGTYKSPPPPGEHHLLHQLAKRELKREPIRLNAEQQRIALDAVLAKARSIDAEPLAIAIAATHVHLLARFDKARVGIEVGQLKREASNALADHHPGGVWSARCHPRPVFNQQHQRDAFHYIAAHAQEGALVWTYRDE